MLGHHIRNFIPLGERKVDDLYDETAFPPGATPSIIKVDGGGARLFDELAFSQVSMLQSMLDVLHASFHCEGRLDV